MKKRIQGTRTGLGRIQQTKHKEGRITSKVHTVQSGVVVPFPLMDKPVEEELVYMEFQQVRNCSDFFPKTVELERCR